MSPTKEIVVEEETKQGGSMPTFDDLVQGNEIDMSDNMSDILFEATSRASIVQSVVKGRASSILKKDQTDKLLMNDAIVSLQDHKLKP